MLNTTKTVQIIRSTDANAPVLTNQGKELCSIIKACAVTGFGTTQPLGWSIAYEDIGEKKLVIKMANNVGASGGYLSINDINANYAIIRGYLQMSDINTGTPVMGEGEFYYQCSDSAGNTNEWLCVGHDTAFVLCIRAGGWWRREWVWLWFGDLPFFVNNTRACGLSFAKDYRSFMTDWLAFNKSTIYIATLDGVKKYGTTCLLPDTLQQTDDLIIAPIYIITDTSIIPWSGLYVVNRIANDSRQMQNISNFDNTVDSYVYVASASNENDPGGRGYGGHTAINVTNWVI